MEAHAGHVMGGIVLFILPHKEFFRRFLIVGNSFYLFILGYTGWGPGQLENELVENGWLTLPASNDIIFDMPDELKWKAAAMQYGIDIATFKDDIGYA